MITINFDSEGNLTFSYGKREKIERNKGKSLLDFVDDYVVIDVETTGVDPYYDELIEVAAIRYKKEKKIDCFQELIKPQCEISDFISELTGITNEMVQEARNEQEVIKDFYDFIGNSIIIGHNIHFDINFIYDSLLTHHNIKFKNNFIDTLRLSRRILPNLKKHKLTTLISYYNMDNNGNHRALNDVKLTNGIYQFLKKDAISHYGNIEEFKKSIRKKSSSRIAKEIVGDKSKNNKDNLLYGKVCVVTGKLENMSRKEALQIIADIGGIQADNVTKKTNFLILGNFDYSSNIKGNKSSKLKKAEKYKLEGQDLEIISENVFYELISEKNEVTE
ncbi:exonuclease domain-containing protein [Staphylococcus petrasii]|uniref:exonuclease domain-containing protein n=1 Tax=Staphylococcus petrasii TaxID=1276936 RepID=UPI001F567F99|nr:exonuclease domain-containing protein [Staphylococcus petrasii]MCI2773803.1 3'-5' exoribonuclease [Staphylococcus petrasii]